MTASTGARRTSADVFDELHRTALPLVRRGRHQTDAPPSVGGRWPVSVVCLPGPDSSDVFDSLTTQAAELAGSQHWWSGAADRAHFTVRALEGHRPVVPENDAAVARYLGAVDRTASRCPQFALRLTGLVLTPGTVMATAEPVDGRAFTTMDVLEDELSADAWYEQQFGQRDIWYVNLVHFTGPVREPEALVDWVESRRTLGLGTVELATLSLVRFELSQDDVPGMRPVALGCRPLTGAVMQP